METVSSLRARIDGLNRELLALVQERAEVVLRLSALKREQGYTAYDPGREEAMIRSLLQGGSGPLRPDHIRSIFTAIFRASLEIQESPSLPPDGNGRVPVASVRIGNVTVGGGEPVLFFGPCSVESVEQLDEVAPLARLLPGRAVLRGGTYKPRTSPESFQGLREEGVRILGEAGARHGVPTVTEVLDLSSLDVALGKIDMIQIGARSMYNTELLKAVGRARVPVFLKRAFMATIDEVVSAVRYIRAEGNHDIVLCERGIRSFDYRTRNTLDIAAVPLLRAETGLPVVVDVSHAVGRTDLILPCARAALAVGADGLMIEVHPDPPKALSDSLQQIDPGTFARLLEDLELLGEGAGTAKNRPGTIPAGGGTQGGE